MSSLCFDAIGIILLWVSPEELRTSHQWFFMIHLLQNILHSRERTNKKKTEHLTGVLAECSIVLWTNKIKRDQLHAVFPD